MALLPTELLRATVFLVVNSCPVEDVDEEEWERDIGRYDTACAKSPWTCVSNLVHVSHAMRDMALDAWFRILRIRCRDKNNIAAIVAQWPTLKLAIRVREIQIDGTNAEPATTWSLSALPGLHTVRIALSKRPETLPLSDLPHSLSELHLATEVCTLDMCKYIARTLPQLRALYLDAVLVCPLCTQPGMREGGNRTPVFIIYKDGIGLPKNYAAVLASMQELRIVYLSTRYRTCPAGTSEIGERDTLWSGECKACTANQTNSFLRNWAKEKRDYKRPTSLKSVVWRLAPFASFARMTSPFSPFGRESWFHALDLPLPSVEGAESVKEIAGAQYLFYPESDWD